MLKFLLVARFEIATTLRKPSFWFMAFLFPAIVLGLTTGANLMAEPIAAESTAMSGRLGYVDPASYIRAMPEDVDAGRWIAYADERAASRALTAGEVDAYYVISSTYIDSGELTLVASHIAPTGSAATAQLEYILAMNLVGDSSEAQAAARTISVSTSLLAADSTAPVNDGGFAVTYGAMFVFFFVLVTSSSMLLQSVGREKENRTAEVLLLAMSPEELVLGKVLGAGFLALLQIGIWLWGAQALMSQTMGASGIELLQSMSGWGIAYFALGFLTYASLMAGLGAVAPSAREAGQFTFLVLLPLMLPLWLNSVFLRDPNGPLATTLSLFPLSSPVSMPTRLMAAAVPVWQPIAGLLLLLVTAFGAIRISARMLHADALLSYAAVTWARLGQAIRRS